ncbi:hypothetical protein TNCV_152981 [Trichonephila clavipes]|nr:hypothetical protein TNCV_152981 [Trichonephila clavipes]
MALAVIDRDCIGLHTECCQIQPTNSEGCDMWKTNQHRAWGCKPSLVGDICKSSYEVCDIEGNGNGQ